MDFKFNNIDCKFEEYFRGRIKQVFLYVTDNCNLRCTQCLYKPWLGKNGDIPEQMALILLTKFREMGAVKLSLIGGEPTLYGYSNFNKPLLNVIDKARKLGYDYIRLDTNGQFDNGLLEQKSFRKLDELSFSIDSHICEVDDSLRGKGSFKKTLMNLVNAVKLGYKVDITCCVHRGNIGKDQSGNFLIESMIQFAENNGVSRINFHPLFRMGVPRDEWAGKTDISPDKWIELYLKMYEKIKNKSYNIPVRVPQRFITKKEFDRNPEYYGFCPVKQGERVLVHPNGLIQICALRIGTPHAVAQFNEHGIMWQKERNELNKFKLDEHTPCTNQHRDFGKFVPLCISFKPKQDEIVWGKELEWEKRKIN